MHEALLTAKGDKNYDNTCELLGETRKYKAVGFIKSRKSEGQVMEIATDMIKKANKIHLDIFDIIVDRSSGIDIDREKIDELVAIMEHDSVDAVVVRSITEISKDMDDIRVFLDIADKWHVFVYDMSAGFNMTNGQMEV